MLLNAELGPQAVNMRTLRHSISPKRSVQARAWGSPTLLKSTNQPAAQLDLIHALIEISGNVWECKTARDVGIVQSSIPMNDSL